jgi:hypothetical protein
LISARWQKTERLNIRRYKPYTAGVGLSSVVAISHRNATRSKPFKEQLVEDIRHQAFLAIG